jgi:hypothetical protein
MKRLMFFLIVVGIMPCLAQVIGHQPTPTPNLRDVDSHYASAEAHRELALKYVQEATEQSMPARLGQAQGEFDRAADEYLAYASIANNESENWRITCGASGLLKSYHAPAALRLILEHPNIQGDPRILRIKADALLALGLDKEAALTYEEWIGRGKCGSIYRNWPGEPRLGHPIVLLMPKGTNDPCAALAPELRVRLETLQRLFGHPNNLPRKNYKTSPLDTN